MKLNVILITYNQENYIRQTLESILMQKTTFDFNIIVADDFSPDYTLDIIKEYVDKTEIAFQFLSSDKNLGYTKNYQRAFAACHAEYIAIMEGDDYWTSPYHLQLQFDFLEKHQDCTMTFNRHNRLFVDKDYNNIPEWLGSEKDYRFIEGRELALGNQIGNLSCCVIRGSVAKQLKPAVFDACFFADWLLGMYLGLFGSLAQLKEVTSTYRVHDNGQWSRMSEEEQYRTILKMIDEYDPLLDYKYTDEFSLYKKRININLYGDKSLKGRFKNLIPSCIINVYKKIRYE